MRRRFLGLAAIAILLSLGAVACAPFSPAAPAPALTPAPVVLAATPPATVAAPPTETPRPTASATPAPTSTATRAAPTATATPTATTVPSPTASATPFPAPAAVPAPVTSEEFARGDPAKPWVSLVFNAGAGYEPAPAILDALREKGVRTTFFVMGWWAEKQPDLLRRIAAEGHEIASHGYKEFDLTKVSDEAVIADLERADAVIGPIVGRTTKPLWSPSAGYRDARVRRLAASLGYRTIYLTVDSGDWRTEATAEGVRRVVLERAANGAIIVMHFESPRTADTVAATVPSIIDGLRAKGLRLVTVSELLTGRLAAASPP